MLGQTSDVAVLAGNENVIDSHTRVASAHDGWLRSFLYPMGCLEFEVLCYSLRVLICVDVDDFEPAHLEDVDTKIAVRETVDKGVFLRTIA